MLNGNDFSDNGTRGQDIRFSGGSTASEITLADYSDFGSDFRSMSSTSVYGNKGIVAQGPGANVTLVNHNFAYIGSGKSYENDDTAAIQANEVVATNSAKVNYNSTDQSGDFRLGELFHVNQKTGVVEFKSADIRIDTAGSMTINNGSDATVIDSTKIETNKLRMSGQTIQSLAGDLNLNSSSNLMIIREFSLSRFPVGSSANTMEGLLITPLRTAIL